MHRLDADSIFLRYGDRTILAGAYLSCRTGETVGILGRNGEGKSSLLHILNGDLRADNRVIHLDNRYRGDSLYRDNGAVAFLPQSNFLPPNLRVERIISLFLPDRPSREALRDDDRVGARLDIRIGDLSGGERRYLEILLILHLDRAFLLLDEPFTGLDPLYAERVTDLLRVRRDSQGILVTDHTYRNILAVSDRLLLLRNGELLPVRDRGHLERLGYLPEE